MKHSEWLIETTGNASPREVGRKAGISFRTVHDQSSRDRLSAENVIKISEAYGVHPVSALIDCDLLAAKWATTSDPVAAIRKVSDEQLADEVLRRMKLGSHVEFETPINELEQRRSNRTTPDVDITQYDLVADSSPDEKEGDPSDYEA